MRFDGIVKTWNDDRGFGFIEPVNGGQELFVHIKAFPAGSGRPTTNQRVSFEVELSADGKKRAKNVELTRTARVNTRPNRRATVGWRRTSVVALLCFALVYLFISLVWGTPLNLAIAYLVMSIVCVLAYIKDKNAAQEGGWRTSEGTLLMLGLFGGWPGAIVAQEVLRHKTSKESFRAAFWGTVVLNVAAFVAMTTPLIGATKG